jgi:hypothetical protein
LRVPYLKAAKQAAPANLSKDIAPNRSFIRRSGGTASTANGHNLGEIFKSTGVAYAAGPAFQWNILNYGQITNNVRLQDATLQQLKITVGKIDKQKGQPKG